MTQAVSGIAITPPKGAAPGRVTREDVLNLARSGDAWRAVPYCLQVLRVVPQDDEMRCQAAGLFARLGLRTPAMELLESVSPAVAEIAAVRSLRAMVERLAPDRIGDDERRGVCERNLAVVRAEAGVKARWYEAWEAMLGKWMYLRTNDGNVVVREMAGDSARPWVRFRNDATEAMRFPLPHLSEGKGVAPRAYTLEGMDPPHLFRRIAKETPRMADGYQPWLRVVQRDPVEFLDGLAMMDLREELSEPRVCVYVGEDATEQMKEDLRGRWEAQIAGSCITLATVRARCTPSAEVSLRESMEEQAAEDRRLKERVSAAYSSRTKDEWRRMYSRAGKGGEGGARRLRVLIPTCRFSTYIKHSSADLARAFEDAGHEARVLIEPDDFSKFSSVAYRRAMEEFRPDLVVLINYTRSHLDGVIPAEVPFVTWIQDSMPHQFNVETGRKQGTMDFVVGHMHPELFEQYEYPAERRASMPMVVSGAKFHDAPVTSEERAKYECEIAYVSHHSETPEAMHARLMREAGSGTLASRVFAKLEPRVREIALACANRAAYIELREAASEAIAAAMVSDPDGNAVTQILRQYCMPLADRMVRHQTLEWAAGIAERRGWRLYIYGRGWEKHSRFGAFAKGELPHDEALRAAYQCAALHLHMSINTPVHQRVMEGAMSGGLVACRMVRDGVNTMLGSLRDAVMDECGPDTALKAGGYPGYCIADSARAMSLVAQLQRLGEGPTGRWAGWVFVSPEMLAEHETAARRLHRDFPTIPDLLGDVSEVTYRNEGELEKLVVRAVEDSAWRVSRSRMIARQVKKGMTYDVLVERVVGMVRGEMQGLGIRD